MRRSPIPLAALCALWPLAGCNGDPQPVVDDPPTEATSDASAETETPEPPAAGPLRVLLEVDHMQGTRALKDEHPIGGQPVSLADVYAPAGIALTVVHDDTDVPAPAVLRLGDLHQIMTTFRSVPQGDADLHVYCLVATEEFGSADTLGIMFDFGVNDDNDVPREAFAVFSGAHDDLADPDAELLLTTAHELAHCFNLHHTDWEGRDFFERATVESYSFSDTVVWGLSSRSREHLAHHPAALVRPGAASLAFGTITSEHADRHQAIPDEGYNVVGREAASRARRGQAIEKAQVVRSAAARRALGRSSRLSLTLVPPKQRWEPGEPVTVTAVLKNEDDEPLDVVPLLDPAFGFLSLSVARTGGQPTPFHPPLRSNGRGKAWTTLSPGELIEHDCKLFLGSEGWVFDQPGEYVVEASYTARTRERVEWVPAAPLTLAVEAPRTDSARRASKRLVEGNGNRAASFQAGLYLYFDGGEHLVQGVQALEELAREQPDTAQAAGARYSLGIGALLPTYDAKQKAAPAADLEQAQRYLEDVLEDERAVGDKLFAQRALTEQMEKSGRADEADELRRRTLERLLEQKPDLSPEQLRKLDYDALLEKKGAETFRRNAREQIRRIEEGDGR